MSGSSFRLCTEVGRKWLEDRFLFRKGAVISEEKFNSQKGAEAGTGNTDAQLRLSIGFTAIWLLVKTLEELSGRKQKMRAALLEHHPQAQKVCPLIGRFVHMVKHRKPEQLDQWLKDAKGSNLSPIVQLATGLQRDYQAVKAGLSMEWSNGQVEGQINRLKLIKRQAYGRAKPDLLKKRVFYKPAHQAA